MPIPHSKRLFDLLGASGGIALFSPLALAISGCLFIEDGKPIFFTQKRLGQGRQSFTLLKFRTMNKEVVTRTGHWLRNTGLDELPQLLQVLSGEMSLVGPRPLTAKDVHRLGWDDAQFDPRWAVPPGITGLAQLLGGRGARQSWRLDRLYLQQQSPELDLWLLFWSVGVNLCTKRNVQRWMRGQRIAAKQCCL